MAHDAEMRKTLRWFGVVDHEGGIVKAVPMRAADLPAPEGERHVLNLTAVEFQSRLNPDQTLTIPASVTDAIPIGQAVRVLILIPETDKEWEAFTAEGFGQGYAETDAIHDQRSGW